MPKYLFKPQILLVGIFMLVFSFLSCSDTSEKVYSGPQQVDSLVQQYMDKYHIQGASVAITKDEKLVYRKAYGFADTAAQEAMHTGHLFRIASISKPVTGVAIFKLMEQGKLDLDQTVFGPEGILGERYGTPPYKGDIPKITVRHLMQHTAGGWSNSKNDPMFFNKDWSMDKLIGFTLDSVPLQDVPGTRYAYSNFGFCILGRVIEELTGQDYETYLQDSILRSIGAQGMRVGGNTLAERLPNEVIYYGDSTSGPDAYKYNITRMDAHGGWIASPSDLVRLMAHVDGRTGMPDVLSVSNVALMTEVSDAKDNATYAYSWRVDSAGTRWHSGSLPGTSTHLRLLPNGNSWSILTNGRVKGNFADLEPLLNATMQDESLEWPEQDLFSTVD